MEPVYRVLNWHKQDVLDTVEGLLKPYIQIHLDSQLPLTIQLFRLPMPTSKTAFEALVTKCLSIPVEFNSFKILPNNTISCKFSFFSQQQTLTLVYFQQLKPYDLVLLQKKLISLKFSYTIPNTHLSFDVLNTKFRFIFNASYNAYVADRGWSYSTFLSNYKGPPLSAEASGSGPPSLIPIRPPP